VNAGRAWETMGWYARTSFEDGLRETVQWYLEREGARI
jgi:dTDP-D-glucose 4,6-dehydratase